MKPGGKIFLSAIILILFPATLAAQRFKHPGIDQTAEDIAFIKSQVLAWNQPWKDAFERLKASADLNTQIKPFTYVFCGPNGNPDIGAKEVRMNADLAYNCALIWVITGEKKYAGKAIEILNAWSQTLTGFDYEEAQLVGGQSAYLFCNAAEILRYSGSGWLQRDIDRFTRMIYDVYFPLLRNYSPQTNGSYDAVIVQGLLSIAVFSDNASIFNNAVDHYLHGASNGSLFRYIYPDGQCHESSTDPASAKAGLFAYAGAARIAFSQGIDLFQAGGNRIALGYEYLSRVLLNENTSGENNLTPVSGRFDDIFEPLYRHYKSKGFNLPYTSQVADSARKNSIRVLLTATRSANNQPAPDNIMPVIYPRVVQGGAQASVTTSVGQNAIIAEPGMPLQVLLDSASITGKSIILKKGIYKLPHSLKLTSGITISGEGKESIITLESESGDKDVITNSGESLNNVIIRDLVISGNPSFNNKPFFNTSQPHRNGQGYGGIRLWCNSGRTISSVQIINVTVQNCILNGVFIQGVQGIRISFCDFTGNGSDYSAGPYLQHNLYIRGSSDVFINDSRLDASPSGCGIAVSGSRKVEISGCEIARNGRFGLLLSESDDISVTGNLIEASIKNGIMAEYLFNGCGNLSITNNNIQYNGSFGIETYAVKKLIQAENKLEGNGRAEAQLKISEQKEIQVE